MITFQCRFLTIVILVFLVAMIRPAAAESRLLMVTSDHCHFCQAWEKDIGEVYDQSPYALDLPLTRVKIGSAMPHGVALLAPVIGTPTFIVLRDGLEIDRQRGYHDAEIFWWWLSENAGD